MGVPAVMGRQNVTPALLEQRDFAMGIQASHCIA